MDERINYINDNMDKWRSDLLKNRYAKSYLKSRRISIETAKRLGLGYCKSDKVIYIYNSIIVPNINENSKLVGIQARSISSKWFKTIGSLPINMNAINSRKGYVFLCEGMFDYLSLEECGYPTILTGTTSIKKDAIRIISKSEKTVFIVFDNERIDKGPFNAVKTAMKFPENISVYVTCVPRGEMAKEDVNNFFVRNGKDMLMKSLSKNAKSITIRKRRPKRRKVSDQDNKITKSLYKEAQEWLRNFMDEEMLEPDSRYVQTKCYGNHDNLSNSLTIYLGDEPNYYCYGCHEYGSIYKLMKKFKEKQ